MEERPIENEDEIKTAYFDRVTVSMPLSVAEECSLPGRDATESVEQLQGEVTIDGTPEQIRKQLYEYGAWDDTELQDDEENRKRIIWIAAGDIIEEMGGHFRD